MNRLLLPALACLAFASCASVRPAASNREAFAYKAVQCDCRPDDGFGFERHSLKRDTGTVAVNPRRIVKRTSNTITVNQGQCVYTYLAR